MNKLHTFLISAITLGVGYCAGVTLAIRSAKRACKSLERAASSLQSSEYFIYNDVTNEVIAIKASLNDKYIPTKEAIIAANDYLNNRPISNGIVLATIPASEYGINKSESTIAKEYCTAIGVPYDDKIM